MPPLFLLLENHTFEAVILSEGSACFPTRRFCESGGPAAEGTCGCWSRLSYRSVLADLCRLPADSFLPAAPKRHHQRQSRNSHQQDTHAASHRPPTSIR